MKNTGSITSLSIDELIADTGRTKLVNNFHVFRSEELNKEKRTSKPVRFDHFIVILATEGSSHIRLNLTDHFIQKNSLLIISPNVIHEFVGETNSAFIGVGFIPEFFSHLGLNMKQADTFTFFSSQNDPYFSLTNQEAATLSQIMLLLYEKDHIETDHPFKEEMLHHAFGLFIFELAAIARKYRGDNNFKLTRKEDIMLSFLKVLPIHFKEERSVQFYANLLFITPKHLTKTVKELTHKTCGEWIDDMVIMEAKVLLNDAALSVANVAGQLHFSDQFFFSKFFKRYTGLTPTEFRTNP
ncbi:MAG: transcriptional regulator, AraC family [Chitinophagaceae bacterium]|nr:transcriptional regulator, AraC family [Chitinophagaceae bacterium]